MVLSTTPNIRKGGIPGPSNYTKTQVLQSIGLWECFIVTQVYLSTHFWLCTFFSYGSPIYLMTIQFLWKLLSVSQLSSYNHNQASANITAKTRGIYKENDQRWKHLLFWYAQITKWQGASSHYHYIKVLIERTTKKTSTKPKGASNALKTSWN